MVVICYNDDGGRKTVPGEQIVKTYRVKFYYTDAKSHKPHVAVYKITSALDLFDRLMRIRSKKFSYFTIMFSRRNSIYDRLYRQTIASGHSGYQIKIDLAKMGTPDYMEELAVECFDRVSKL